MLSGNEGDALHCSRNLHVKSFNNIWLNRRSGTLLAKGTFMNPEKVSTFSDSILVPKNPYTFTLNYIGENLAWLRAG